MRHSFSLLILIPALACLPTISVAGWTPDGVRVTNSQGYEVTNSLLSDHAGGAIVFWIHHVYDNYHAQRLNALGNLQWASDGAPVVPQSGGYVLAAITDGADGAFAVLSNVGLSGLRMQRFDGSGKPQWAPDGVLVANVSYFGLARVVGDQAGGVILIYQDWRPGQENQLYGQRVDASGAALWGLDGIPLVVLPSGQSWRVQQAGHSIDSDGAGGVVATWQDFRSHTQMDVYAQRLSPSGQRMWGDEAVLLCLSPAEQREPSIASDGTGGAFAAWTDLRSPDGVYAQHVDAAGAIQWGGDGLAIRAEYRTEYSPLVVSDGGTGAFIVWTDMRNSTYDKYIQRYDAAGTPQWTPGGETISTLMGDRDVFAVIPDNQGGALIGFNQQGEIRAQKMDPSGARQWGDNGILMGNGNSPLGITDGAGGMIAAWYRVVGNEENLDVFAQRITNWGTITTAVDTPLRNPSLRVREIYPNPFSGATTLEIELAAPSSVRVAVFDVAGRRVRDMSLPVSAGSQRVEFDGRDDSGKLLASGVYFCKVEARGESVTRKVVITR